MNKQELVTIAIPTYNRAGFLKTAIESCVKQTYQNIEILILDGGSTDNTKQVVDSFNDPRIVYYKNEENIGMMRSWNKCIELSKGEFVIILGDDDRLHIDFIVETMKVYRNYPNLGFVFTHADKVDINGNFIMRWGYDFAPSGYLSGLDYLFYTIKYVCCLTNSSTMICNKRVFKKVGLYKAEFAKNTFDFNMYIKIASKFDVYFLNKVLSDYRIHPEQVSEIHWRRKERPTGKIGTYLEILKAISLLLSNDNFTNQRKKKFVYKQLPKIDSELTLLLMKIAPEL